MHSMSPGGALKDTFPDTEDLVTGWGTVTRGNPPAHLLPTEELPAAGLTEATWFVDIEADPFVEHPHVRSPAEVQAPVRLDLAGLRALGEAHGTVKVMKATKATQTLGQWVFIGKNITSCWVTAAMVDKKIKVAVYKEG